MARDLRAPRRVWGPVSGLVVLAACAEPSPRTWDELDRTERAAFMLEEVLPRMADIFAAHDPERFAGFACESCHGVDLVDVDYAMPNALGALPTEGTLEVAMARDPVMTQFMLDDVFPVMVELLDGEKYSESDAPDGLRCTICHLVAP